MKVYLVYGVFNTKNGKWYIGQTCQTLSARRKQHLDSARLYSKTYFQRALTKYGGASFTWVVLEVSISEEIIDNREKYWIQFYKSFYPAFGYNRTPGGEGGIPGNKSKSGQRMSQETKDKISKSLKGQKWSDTKRQNYSKARKGIPMSESQKKVLSERMHVVWEERNKDLRPDIRGIKRTETTRQKMRDAWVRRKNKYTG